MKFNHEIISFPKNVPLNLSINRLGNVGRHWHQSLEIVFVVHGDVTVKLSDKTHNLSVGDVMLINPNEIHELHSEDATMVTLHLKLELLPGLPENVRQAYFDCVSNGTDSTEKFNTLKSVVADLLRVNLQGGQYVDVLNLSLCYRLVYELYASFATDTVRRGSEEARKLDRLSSILSIINDRYTEDLSLETIAGEVYLTVPYLSKFFKSCMGVTVSRYIRTTRLYHAANDLLSPGISIESIAEKNGFPNTRAFVSAFKEEYGELPSNWRKRSHQEPFDFVRQEQTVNYINCDPHITRSYISDFIRENSLQSGTTAVPGAAVESDAVSISVDKNAPLLRHNCRSFIGVSRAHELLEERIREDLRRLQQNAPFRYIKMHSILDDDMMVYSEGPKGEAEYNFNLIDDVFDFLLSVRLRPLVQFSFMPSALASSASKTTFYCKTITSEPKNMHKWSQLLKRLTEHLIDRYGKDEVQRWLFCVWNEPSSSNKMFGFKDKDTFIKLYENSYRAVKSVCTDLQFGGPASFSAMGKSEDWLFDFLHASTRAGVRPDFINIHYYDIDLTYAIQHPNDNDDWTDIFLSTDPDSFGKFVSSLKERLFAEGFDDLPVYITEWNSTVSHRDLLNDTCFKSAYIAKNVLENYDALSGYGYWLLSDRHSELRMSEKLFHGGMGLFTANGIAKPSYFVYMMLAKMGKRFLSKGDGYFVTANDDEIILTLYNYHHFSEAYAKEVGIFTSYTDRYSIFPDKAGKLFKFDFPELSGNFIVKSVYVNQKHGSAYDEFVRMGAVEPLYPEETKWLNDVSKPRLKKEIVSASPLSLSISLAPFEVRQVAIKKLS